MTLPAVRRLPSFETTEIQLLHYRDPAPAAPAHRVNAEKGSLVGSANKTMAALVAGVRYSYSEQLVNRFSHWALATKTFYELC